MWSQPVLVYPRLVRFTRSSKFASTSIKLTTGVCQSASCFIIIPIYFLQIFIALQMTSLKSSNSVQPNIAILKGQNEISMNSEFLTPTGLSISLQSNRLFLKVGQKWKLNLHNGNLLVLFWNCDYSTSVEVNRKVGSSVLENFKPTH